MFSAPRTVRLGLSLVAVGAVVVSLSACVQHPAAHHSARPKTAQASSTPVATPTPTPTPTAEPNAPGQNPFTVTLTDGSAISISYSATALNPKTAFISDPTDESSGQTGVATMTIFTARATNTTPHHALPYVVYAAPLALYRAGSPTCSGISSLVPLTSFNISGTAKYCALPMATIASAAQTSAGFSSGGSAAFNAIGGTPARFAPGTVIDNEGVEKSLADRLIPELTTPIAVVIGVSVGPGRGHSSAPDILADGMSVCSFGYAGQGKTGTTVIYAPVPSAVSCSS